MIDGRSAADQRPLGPKASAVVVDIVAPAAGLTARVDRATATVTVGGAPLPASYVFVVGGDSAIVDATATNDPVSWETIIGIDTRRPLGPVVRPVFDLRKGDWIEYRFTRPGVLRLAVVFDEHPAFITSAVIAAQTLDVARTQMPLAGQWEGGFAWRGVVGQLRFVVDSAAYEITDLNIGFSCTKSADQSRQGAPKNPPDINVNIPTPLARIRANGAFSFASEAARMMGAGKFVTADSATGTFTGAETLGCPGGARIAMKGPWVARRTTQPVPPRPPYTFQVDSVITPSVLRNVVSYCGFRSDTTDIVLEPAAGGTLVKVSGTLEIRDNKICIWMSGAVHRWIGAHNVFGGPISSIQSDNTAPLRFRVRFNDYEYLSGKGTLTTAAGQLLRLPRRGARLVGEEPEVTATRWPEERAVDLRNARVVELARRSCDGGDMAGCYSLGLAYAAGRGVTRDYMRSVELYRKACDGGNMDGCVSLGRAHAESLGSGYINQAVVARSVEFYRRACDGGNMQGCALLGYAYAQGRDLARDDVRAVELVQRACDAHVMGACKALASSYSMGEGVPRSKTRAEELYQRACEDGDMSACDLAGGVGKEVELYQRACDSGNHEGCSRLGQAYEQGRGVPKSITRAVELHRRACDGDSRFGCFVLGRLYDPKYDFKRGVPPNDTLAVQFYRRACNGEVMEACYSLGLAYAEGRGGLAQNDARAADLFQRACNGGGNLERVIFCEKVPERSRRP